MHLGNSPSRNSPTDFTDEAKITVRILDDINDSIQRYMLMLLATNVLVGLLTWLAECGHLIRCSDGHGR